MGQIVRVPWHHKLTWEHVEDPNKGDANVLFMDEPMRHPDSIRIVTFEFLLRHLGLGETSSR